MRDACAHTKAKDKSTDAASEAEQQHRGKTQQPQPDRVQQRTEGGVTNILKHSYAMRDSECVEAAT